jgi:molybdate transport system substrate-binding protein
MYMGCFLRIVLAASLVAACTGTTDGRHESAPPILVSAAASLSEVISNVGRAFERETGIRVLLNVAGSQVLAAQIIEGAPFDVFVSADERQMARTIDAGLIDIGQTFELLSNQLVVVVPSDRLGTVTHPDDLTDALIRRVALGDPEAVPAGVYAREYLKEVGVWDSVSGKIVPTRNVRAALRAVELGAVEAAVVYRTDVATSLHVQVAFEVPLESGPRIVYPIGVSTDPQNREGAARFKDFLQSPEARRLFEASGFVSLLGLDTSRSHFPE